MWYKRFDEGSEHIRDNKRSGRSSIVMSSHFTYVQG